MPECDDLRRDALIPIVVVLVLVTASVGSAQGVATEADVDMTFVSLEEAEALIEQRWEGQDAADFRQSLDVLFGDADGRLTSQEIDQIVQATELDLEDASFPLLSLNDEMATVEEVSVTMENAVGAVDSQDPFSMQHDLVLSFEEADADADTHELVLDPQWRGTFTVAAPSGWQVESTEGLEDVTVDGDAVTGTFQEGEAAVVVFSEDTGPLETIANVPPWVLWLGAALILVVVAVALGYRYGRKRP